MDAIRRARAFFDTIGRMMQTADPAKLERLPPRLVPGLYLAGAHIALITAFSMLAWRPGILAGFFYHPQAMTLVHLVTLGWITGSILGWIYMVGPIALRTPIAARRTDIVACALFLTGVAGLVSHFWLNRYNGMLWSAGMLLLSIAFVAWRVLRAVLPGTMPRPIKLHIVLAFVNMLVAGIWGALTGLEKLQVDAVPGHILANVFAHAHLAALGFATMMVIGLAYRLLPMMLPSAVPPERGLYASACLLEIGVLGLFAGLITASRWTGAFAVLSILGIVAFASRVAWMIRSPRPAPKALVKPDYGVLHAMQAIGYLALSATLGMALLYMQPSETELRLMPVYGLLGLVGFLSQIVIGVATRILPLVTWLQQFVRYGQKPDIPSQYAMMGRRVQAASFTLWTLGVPVLAVGLITGNEMAISVGAAALAAATLLVGMNVARILRYAF